MTLDLDAIEARAWRIIEHDISADGELLLALTAEVCKLREALACIESGACACENLHPDCGFEEIESIARQALEAKEPSA